MAKKTKRDIIIDALIDDNGCIEVECRSGKYRQFKRPEVDDSFIFVGRNGAVRVGRVATKSTSITNTKWVKEILLEKWLTTKTK